MGACVEVVGEETVAMFAGGVMAELADTTEAEGVDGIAVFMPGAELAVAADVAGGS